MGVSVVGEPLGAHDPAELGRYRLLGRLGEGGMGVVYLAEDPAGRSVAVKVIRPQLASHDEFRARFRSEVALARKVARFCTAPIIDSDTEAEQPYVVTEFIDGPTLSAAVAEHGPLPGSQLHALGIGVASALTAIHRAGVVHRDLKPSNVLLSRFGPRVIDFGIARAVDSVSAITVSGQLIGSPAYMAPEQVRGEDVTTATDLFAWGAVMAYAGTGRPPFGATTEAIAYRVLHGEADLDGLDPELLDTVRWALSKDPAARPSAQRLLDELLQHDQRTPAGPDRPALVVERAAHAPATTTSSLVGDLPPASTPVPVQPARRRRTWIAVAGAAVLAGGAAFAGVTLLPANGRPAAKPAPSPAPAMAPIRFDDRAAGPAAAVPGANRGGTVTGLRSTRWDYLDPQRAHDRDAMSVGSSLLYRTLTGYVDDGGGRLRLVGDLATDTGRTDDGGKTWRYTLRPGMTFQDGSPITAGDVAYGIARSFAADLSGGPTELQSWLAGDDFRGAWPGPYATGQRIPPGVAVAGRTITFTFAEPHPELPMVAALGTTAPVPKAADRRTGYDGAIVSSGPYRIASSTGRRLELVRNPAWDPRTDPIRHAYPDRWVFEFDVPDAAATDRLFRTDPPNQTAFMWSSVPELAAEIGPDRRKRTLDGVTPFNRFLAINNLRVKDLAVRRAINAAIDRRRALQVYRGESAGTPTTALISSAVPGHRADAGPGTPLTGDPDKARALLGGKRLLLTYAHGESAADLRLATYLRNALEAVGFQVKTVPIKGGTAAYYAALGSRNNTYDLYLVAWGPDIPDASGIFPHLFSGAGIRAESSTNVAYFSDPTITARIRSLQAEPDRARAARGVRRARRVDPARARARRPVLRRAAPLAPRFAARWTRRKPRAGCGGAGEGARRGLIGRGDGSARVCRADLAVTRLRRHR